ncbi:MAG: M56 family metallopeptidase [Bernardetiaceae bacterium]|nr:M56 family metallopeptidase [Bernardetiaceae bacterium]
MTLLLSYIVQVNLYLVLFYLLYRWFLHKETFFVSNRMFLLVATCLSLYLPINHLELETGLEVREQIEWIGFDVPSVSSSESAEVAPLDTPVSETSPTEKQHFGWIEGLIALYAIGVLFMLFRFFIGIFHIIRLVKKFDYRKENGAYVFRSDELPSTFSFLNCVFIKTSPSQDAAQQNCLLEHELVHVREWHSLDMIWINLLHIVFWFNPVMLHYKKALSCVHEYLADQKAIKIVQSESYKNYLVSQLFELPTVQLGNHFYNVSLIKSRVKMMTKRPSNRMLQWKYSLALPLIFLMIFLSACVKEAIHIDEKSQSQKELLQNVDLELYEEFKVLMNENSNAANKSDFNQNIKVIGAMKETYREKTFYFANDYLQRQTYMDFVTENRDDLQFDITDAAGRTLFSNINGQKSTTFNLDPFEKFIVKVKWKEGADPQPVTLFMASKDKIVNLVTFENMQDFERFSSEAALSKHKQEVQPILDNLDEHSEGFTQIKEYWLPPSQEKVSYTVVFSSGTTYEFMTASQSANSGSNMYVQLVNMKKEVIYDSREAPDKQVTIDEGADIKGDDLKNGQVKISGNGIFEINIFREGVVQDELSIVSLAFRRG